MGPLVIAIVSVKKSSERKFADIGVRDSKLLTKKRREELYDEINEIADEVLIDKIQPQEINEAMKNGISLNELEAVRFSKLLDEMQIEPGALYLDSPDVIQEKFGVRVNMYCKKPTSVVGVKQPAKQKITAFKRTKIISEHKADAKYPVVSAASIIAKVVRDEEIRRLEDSLGVSIGSGYPSDNSTVEAVKRNLKNHEFKKNIREYWTTVEEIKQLKIDSFF